MQELASYNEESVRGVTGKTGKWVQFPLQNSLDGIMPYCRVPAGLNEAADVPCDVL